MDKLKSYNITIKKNKLPLNVTICRNLIVNVEKKRKLDTRIYYMVSFTQWSRTGKTNL